MLEETVLNYEARREVEKVIGYRKNLENGTWEVEIENVNKEDAPSENL